MGRPTPQPLRIASAIIGLSSLVVLAGCGLLKRAPETSVPDAGLPTPPRDLAAIPDAVPRDEPRSRYGNPETYEVFGRRYKVMKSAKGHVERGLASWYGPGFHSERTSSGDPYDMYAMTAAHKTLPIPAYVRVTNLENGRSVVVRVNDRGPFVGDRIIDLSYTAAWKLDMLRAGTAKVEIRVLEPGKRSATATTATAATAAATAASTAASTAAVATAPPPPLTASAPPPTARAVGDPSRGRFLQAGSFASRANAAALADRLTAAGIAGATIRESQVGERTLYRVRVGPVADAVQASQLTEQLRGVGIPDARLAPD
jgi:rare lipoprotein A